MMGRIIAKISLVCWAFVLIFTVVMIFAVKLPPNTLAIVAIILGLILTAALGFDFYRVSRTEKLDFEWFTAAGKGFWRVMVALAGLAFLFLGLFAEVFPARFDKLIETGGMTFAKAFVALFWFALISTFLGWALICFSEGVGYRRLRDYKMMRRSFALAFLWQMFTLFFGYLFLDVVSEVFFAISAAIRVWVLIFFAVLTALAGIWLGRYEDLKLLPPDEEK
jgi:hypothetical protein